MQRVEQTLQICFAVLAICCGILLRDAVPRVNLGTISISASLVSLCLVDRWRWFSLPPLLAYLFMLAATAYCMFGFFSFGHGQQLSAVALLLVLVQAVLLFQQKTRRVYEQLTIFCLLQLIVGAVLNDALAFGLLLVPCTIFLLMAFMLLQAWQPVDRRIEGAAMWVEPAPKQLAWGDVRQGLRRSVIAGWVGTVLIAALFFYASPRSRGMQPKASGAVTVGFSDQLTLNQLGTLAGNPQVVMRVRLTDLRNKKPYPLVEGGYLRGVVVDTYSLGMENEAHWRTEANRFFNARISIPEESSLIVAPATQGDAVQVEVEGESTQEIHLFAIAPYYLDRSSRTNDIFHVRGRWLLERNVDPLNGSAAKASYKFNTRGFSNGRAIPWLRPTGKQEFSELRGSERRALTDFDLNSMPAVFALANQIAADLPEKSRSPIDVANAFEAYLRDGSAFKYTQTIDHRAPQGTDPVDDFVKTTRRGHCQYFASALAMMLRSHKIPTRLVIGYRMHEFNELGKYWVVRQHDAHAWVEAYFADSQLPQELKDPDTRRKSGVWLQLDPTPAVSLNVSGQMGQAMDVANAFWREYVVELDSRKGGVFFGDLTNGEMATQSMWERLQATIVRIRAGELGEGRFTLEGLVSWRAAFVAMFLGLVFCLLIFGLRRFWRWLRQKSMLNSRSPGRISIDFFAALMRLLARGKHRPAGETPQTWVAKVSGEWQQRGFFVPILAVESILKLYYRAVYGGRPHLSAEERITVHESLAQVQAAVRRKQP